LIADVFEECAVAEHVVFVLIVADDSLGVADHVVVDIKMITHEVASEEEAYTHGDPSLNRISIEI